MATVTINDREYDTDKLSNEAKQLLGSISACDQKLRQLEGEVAIVKTARKSYANALRKALPTDG